MKDILLVDFDFALAQHESHLYEILSCEFQHAKMPLTQSNVDALPTDIYTVGFISFFSTDSSMGHMDLSTFNLLVIVCAECVIYNESYDLSNYENGVRLHFHNDNIVTISSAAYRDTYTSNIFIHPFFLLNTALQVYVETNIFPKPKLFDALLGLNKQHRLYLLQQLQNSGLIDRCLVSMLTHGYFVKTKEYLYCSPELFELETDEVKSIISNLGAFDSYIQIPDDALLSEKRMVSSQIPVGIYQNSYYSIVAETNTDNFPFITEKTAKPLFAKRLFVAFASKNHLKKLHEYGFQTFGTIIDESYDEIEDDTERWNSAWREILKLSELDPIEVYRQISPILEHNHALITNRERQVKKCSPRYSMG